MNLAALILHLDDNREYRATIAIRVAATKLHYSSSIYNISISQRVFI